MDRRKQIHLEHPVHIGDAINRTLELVEKIQTGVVGVPSGYPSIDRITQGWGEGELIVVGARLAVEKFGAIPGQSRGLLGQSYAIPTNGVSLESIARYVEEFIWFADRHPDMTFLVTRIGCGSAGYTDEQIAPLFAYAYSLPNVFLPETFWKVLSYRHDQY